jgi:hypothetical protein
MSKTKVQNAEPGSLYPLRNVPELSEIVKRALLRIRDLANCEAAGIRLKNNEDYPYLETIGFPPEFLEEEKYLQIRKPEGNPVYDHQGNVVLKGLCGRVIQGIVDPGSPFFTRQGSFWMNSASSSLISVFAGTPGPGFCRCYTDGYGSMAIIPLTYGPENIGLLQVNDFHPGRLDNESITRLEKLAIQLSSEFAPFFT